MSNLKYESYLYDSEASIILVNRDFMPKRDFKATLIKVEDAYQAFASLLQLYIQTKLESKSGVEQPSYIHETAAMGEGVYFGAFAYAGKNASIGNRRRSSYERQEITIVDKVLFRRHGTMNRNQKEGYIHSGAVIGSDGFGFAPQKDGSYQKIPQVGMVILEDDVEIGANTTIDCGTIGPTVVRRGVKLDNLIQIAHNCEVGDHTVIAAQTGLAGSTKEILSFRRTGQFSRTFRGDNVQIGAQSGVVKDVKPNETILASPALDYKLAVRMYAVMRNLPQLRQEVIDLQKEIKRINETIFKKTE